MDDRQFMMSCKYWLLYSLIFKKANFLILTLNLCFSGTIWNELYDNGRIISRVNITNQPENAYYTIQGKALNAVANF